MKTTSYIFLSLGFAAIVMLGGCSKSTENPLTNTNTNNTSGTTVTPSMNDASGVLVALKSVTLVSAGGYTIPSEVNLPVAVFPATQGGSTYQDAGTVTLNNKTLKKESNNSYNYTDVLNPVTYGTQHWTVSGSSGVPSIDYTDDNPMPSYTGQSTLPTTVTKASGLTVNLGSAVSDADSVYVVLISAANSAQVIKHLSGNAASAAFTSSDLSALGAGSGYLEVVPWNYKKEDYSSKNFYFINESAYVVSITIN